MIKIRTFISNVLLAVCVVMMATACGSNSSGNDDPTPKPNPDTETKPTVIAKPRYIWVDAAANFIEFGNSKENIARDLKKAKDAGFTDVVVDVRPTTGDVLFKTQ